MHVFLTGASGHAGSAIHRKLAESDEKVTALVRSQTAGTRVWGEGATPLIGDITNVEWLREILPSFDAIVHTASPGDASSATVDRDFAAAAIEAFAGTGKPYIHSSGAWNYGSGPHITEETPFDPPPTNVWRVDNDAMVVGAADMRGIVLLFGSLYGHGRGVLPTVIAASPRTAEGEWVLIGDGRQHVATVHVDDLADLVVHALERGSSGYYIGASDDHPTNGELTEAASLGAGGSGKIKSESRADTEARFGPALAAALSLDQQTSCAKAHEELGWNPSATSLAEELAQGMYATAPD
jgi:nucleoside-diphosphate-sugar epimerase